MSNILNSTTYLNPEDEYYNQQDLGTQDHGRIQLALVLSYDSTPKTGEAILNNVTYPFINVSSTVLQEQDTVPVAITLGSQTLVCFGLFERP